MFVMQLRVAPSQSKHKLYVGNIPKELNKDSLKEELSAVCKGEALLPLLCATYGFCHRQEPLQLTAAYLCHPKVGIMAASCDCFSSVMPNLQGPAQDLDNHDVIQVCYICVAELR